MGTECNERTGEEVASDVEPVDVEDYVLDASVNLIRDERGVRLAREESD